MYAYFIIVVIILCFSLFFPQQTSLACIPIPNQLRQMVAFSGSAGVFVSAVSQYPVNAQDMGLNFVSISETEGCILSFPI